jgi:uncharacterized protein (TIGR03000 family)
MVTSFAKTGIRAPGFANSNVAVAHTNFASNGVPKNGNWNWNHWHNDWHHHHHNNFFFFPFFGFGFGWGWGWGFDPWLFNGFYWGPRYYDYYYPYPTFFYDGGYAYGTTIGLPQTDVAQGANGTMVEVFVPDEEAQIWVDGRKTTSNGLHRVFASPPLEPGRTYSYTVTAAWNQGGRIVTEERKVDVSAGTVRRVNFAQPPGASP